MTPNDRPAVAGECGLSEGIRNVSNNRHMFFLALSLLAVGASITDCEGTEHTSGIKAGGIKAVRSSAGD